MFLLYFTVLYVFFATGGGLRWLVEPDRTGWFFAVVTVVSLMIKNGGYLTIITAYRQMVVVRQACNVASVNLLQATFNKKSFTK